MMMMTTTRSAVLAVVLLAAITAQPDALAQRRDLPDEGASPLGVVLAVKGGVVLTSPRREFPSLRVGESTAATGTISSRFGEIGTGYRYGAAFLFPFSTKLGLAVDAALQTSVIRLAPDDGRPPIRLDIATVEGGLSLEGNLYSNAAAFHGTGLRAVYIAGGFEGTIGTIANRIEAFRYDSSTTAVPAVGSFDNSDPFRHRVGLRFAGGLRYAADMHFELQAEASYSFALNALFSRDVVSDNDFTFDNIGLMVGMGYRF